MGSQIRETTRGRTRGLAGISAVLVMAGFVAGQSTTRVSVDASANQGDLASYEGSISADGRLVVFSSLASNLVPGDTNGAMDVFLYDRPTGAVRRVSVDSAGGQGDGYSSAGNISADGRYVVFQSAADNLVPMDTTPYVDIFVQDLQSGVVTLVSVDSSGNQANSDSGAPSISADGRLVVFRSAASNLVPGDTNGCADIFVRDLQNGTTVRVSVDSSGQQGDAPSGDAAISADGRWIGFTSFSANLVPGDTNGDSDVFVHDLQSGATSRVSVDSSGGQGAGRSAWGVSLSADGRYVAFTSGASLVPEDTNGINDIYVRDRQTGITRCASLDASGVIGNNQSYYPSLSADGRFVAFQSRASNLVPLDTNLLDDVFVHDLSSGTNLRASVDSSGTQGNASSAGGWLSADGSVIVFGSQAFNLVPGDTNHSTDVFVFVPGNVNVGSFCFGDGTAAACPCGNSGLPFHGCSNSGWPDGALLSAAGFASLSGDTLNLISSGERWQALSVFLQGDHEIAQVTYGDGLLCTAGSLVRLYTHNASSGVASAPAAGDLPVSARSAARGDVIPSGSVRLYQVYYRDPAPSFCPPPAGSTFNASSGLRITWAP